MRLQTAGVQVSATLHIADIQMPAKINGYPPASEASREVANLTWRKNPHTPLYCVKEYVCLSVTNFDLNYLRTGKIERAEIFFRKPLQKSLHVWVLELFSFIHYFWLNSYLDLHHLHKFHLYLICTKLDLLSKLLLYSIGPKLTCQVLIVCLKSGSTKTGNIWCFLCHSMQQAELILQNLLCNKRLIKMTKNDSQIQVCKYWIKKTRNLGNLTE